MRPEFSFRIFIITGELSGDLYGYLLVKRLKELNAAFQFIGIGGPKMRNLGIEILFSAEALSLVGIPSLSELKKYWFAYKKVRELLQKRIVDVVVLVDFPGFNLKVAKLAKELGYPVIYYVAPQVWAWYKSRLKDLKKYVDRLYVILPFEREFFEKNGIKTVFYGHPLIDVVKINLSREILGEVYGLDLDRPIVSFFPGSREKEITKHVPLFLKVYRHLKRKIPEIQGIMVKALGLRNSFLWENAKKEIKVIENTQHEILKVSTVSLLASGTITLEAAILEIPAVVTYSLPPLVFKIAKKLVKVPYVSLPNLILNKQVYPEVLEERGKEEKLTEALAEIILNQHLRDSIKNELKEVKKLLGPPGASWRIAEDMLRYLTSLRKGS